MNATKEIIARLKDGLVETLGRNVVLSRENVNLGNELDASELKRRELNKQNEELKAKLDEAEDTTTANAWAEERNQAFFDETVKAGDKLSVSELERIKLTERNEQLASWSNRLAKENQCLKKQVISSNLNEKLVDLEKLNMSLSVDLEDNKRQLSNYRAAAYIQDSGVSIPSLVETLRNKNLRLVAYEKKLVEMRVELQETKSELNSHAKSLDAVVVELRSTKSVLRASEEERASQRIELEDLNRELMQRYNQLEDHNKKLVSENKKLLERVHTLISNH